MAAVNELRISGRATRDAARMGNGPYRFSIATGGGNKRNSDERWPTEFFDVMCWHDGAKEVRKGQQLIISGRLRQSNWERDGQKHSRVEIMAEEITQPEPPLTPRFPIAEHPPREMKVAEHRPITPQDPITDEDVPWQ